jgi:hypothetical protein
VRFNAVRALQVLLGLGTSKLTLWQTTANNEHIECNDRGGREYNYVIHSCPLRRRLELLRAHRSSWLGLR